MIYNIRSLKGSIKDTTTFQEYIYDVFKKCKTYVVKIFNEIINNFPVHFIILGLLALMNFKWAGLGIIACVISTIILLYILYYLKRYHAIIKKHILKILSQLAPFITNFTEKYSVIIIDTLIFMVYIYIAIFCNIIISFLLTVIFWIFVIGALFLILYEIAYKRYIKKQGDI